MLGSAMENREPYFEEIEGEVECFLHNGSYVFINGRCRFLGIIPFMRGRWKIGAGQQCVRIAIIGDVAEFVGHSVACNHAASDIGDASQVVCGTGRKMTEYNQLGGATTARHRH